jgi:opacity protein-like surface antigen
LRAVILGFMLAALCALALSASAQADEVAPTSATGATGTVGALGADPTVRIAARKHCVSSKVKISPTYTGGGGLVISRLFLNSDLVATRYSIGTLSVSIKRFDRGLNGLELVSEFSDGRVASISRTIRRCGGH